MKVLVFGPSGSGKTYVSQALQRSGINAFGDGDMEGLSAWYDGHTIKLQHPKPPTKALLTIALFFGVKKSPKLLKQVCSRIYFWRFGQCIQEVESF